MVHKNTNNQITYLNSITSSAAGHLGVMAVGMAAVLNVAGIAHMHGEHHATSTVQPAYAVSQAHESEKASSELRRPGREEIRHTSASFGAFQRSPNTAGTT